MATLDKVIKYTNANAIEATWVNDEGLAVKSHVYADSQMQDFRDDVAQYGGDISQYEALIAEVEAAIVPPEVPTIVAPDRVSKKQAKIQLYREGLLDNVINLVNAAGVEAQLSWTEADYFDKSDVLFLQIAGALGKDSTAIDQFFIDASQI